jgi:hypothetical protein
MPVEKTSSKTGGDPWIAALSAKALNEHDGGSGIMIPTPTFFRSL